jgi:integrase
MASMLRQKYQRPTVYATGKREKLWKIEYREYFIKDGKQYSRHKSKTWSRANFTKSEAQAEADKLLRLIQQGGPKPDGAMTLAAFWDEVYYPIRSRKWEWNTRQTVGSTWKLHIKPALGNIALREVTKSKIEIHLGKLADKGYGEVIVDSVRVRLRSIFEEALDNDFIQKNPARKVATPPCKPTPEARSLAESEVHKLWDGSAGRDYLFWRVLIMTGARIGELLALRRGDVGPDGLRIDESAVNGGVKCTKNRKARIAPLADSLRAELVEWMATHKWDLVFPTMHGRVYRRNAELIDGILKRGKVIIPDLTFRMCRTTFGSLFEGDEGDRTSIMGHHSTKFTLEHYRKGVAERQKSSVEALDKRLRKIVEIKKAG